MPRGPKGGSQKTAAKSCVCLAVMILIAGFSVAAAKDSPDVQSLYTLCKASDESQEFALCVGYISGVGSLMQFLGADLRQHPEVREFAICSGSMSYGAMVQAFRTWAEKNPRAWGEPRIIGVMVALTETWPCR